GWYNNYADIADPSWYYEDRIPEEDGVDIASVIDTEEYADGVGTEVVPPTGITIYVDDDNTEGPWDGTPEHPYKYIQDGIDNATAGDTIYVLNGTYHENVLVNKTVDLVGESRENTVVDGSESGTVVYITANNVSISTFTITNGEYGIYISSSSNNITNCVCYDNFAGSPSLPWEKGIGIRIGGQSSNNIIMNSVCYNNSAIGIGGYGIQLYKSSNNSIINCTLYNNSAMIGGCGTHLLGSSYNNFTNCNFYNNTREGIFLSESPYNNFTNCNAYNNDYIGIHLTLMITFSEYSNNNNFTNCNSYNNEYGIIFTCSMR
ncbi:unnamed protein product, partial [marine sediment metagenome]